jgi:hypothetical protein
MASDDLLYVEILGHREALRNLDRLPDQVRAILVAKTESWVEELEDIVVGNIVQSMGSKSGALAAAVKGAVRQQAGRVTGTVSIEGVPYARIQEEGGTTPPHIIRPRNAKILAFIGATGDKVFATHVFHPGGTIQGKHFMKDAYREMGGKISKGVKKAIVDGIRANMRSGR